MEVQQEEINKKKTGTMKGTGRRERGELERKGFVPLGGGDKNQDINQSGRKDRTIRLGEMGVVGKMTAGGPMEETK